MADATCPNCDSPAPSRARSCARCGYTFVEDAGPVPRRPGERRGFSGRALAAGGAAVAVVAAVVVGALLLSGGGKNEEPAAGAGPSGHLPVLAEHPLGRRALERVLEERFLPAPDDDEAEVTCSARIPEPAHSLRRCRVAYPGFVGRNLVVLTTAAGAEVLSEP